MTTRTRIIPGKGVVTEKVFGLPDPAVEVFGTLNVVDGQILVNGTPVSGSGPVEGGYVTIIEDEGELNGTYDSHVVCLGEATVTGEVNIRGNLLAFNDIYNSQGYSFRVRGNAKVRDLEFQHENNDGVQSDIRIDGDLICRNVFFPQGGQVVSSLRVYGDLIGISDETEINLNGNFATNGGSLLVWGDVRISHLYANGGPGDEFTS